MLPYGFDDFPASDDVAVSHAFFSLYRALRYFRQVQARDRSPEQDGSLEAGRGRRIEGKDLGAWDLSRRSDAEAVRMETTNCGIVVAVDCERRTTRIEYGHLHRYLHEAVYLDDDTAFVDEMVLPSPIVALDGDDARAVLLLHLCRDKTGAWRAGCPRSRRQCECVQTGSPFSRQPALRRSQQP